MKVLHLSTSDIEGGASRAAYRLHTGLSQVGIDSQMLVRAKFSIDRHVIADRSPLTKLAPPLSGIPLKLYPKRDPAMFSVQWSPGAIAKKAVRINPDITLLHWICNGFLQIEGLQKLRKLGKPLVWLLHDMWAFTGGCHYSNECSRYQDACGACPHLKSDRDKDLSRWIWERKYKSWQDLNLTIVSPSKWLASCAQNSSLFHDLRVEVIPHGLDLDKFRPTEKKLARQLLNLPSDRRLILFGAGLGTTFDTRKGFQYLTPALQKLSNTPWKEQIDLVVFGANEPEQPPNLGFTTHYLGQFQDDLSLGLVYAAADVMAVPSMYEAFGQTASEALACGTPVVAFNATGLQDIVDSEQNGFLAQPFDADSLAQGIVWILEDNDRWQKLAIAARQKAEREFSLEIQANRYKSLFNELS